MSKPKILVVDDEMQVLDAVSRTLRLVFEVRTASSGAQGLEVLGREPDIGVVMSDMRMPGMNGSAFLAKVRAVAPDTVRLLLTGQSDVEDAIAAVNDGRIFHFLKKPCPPDVLKAALLAAADQHRLITAEKVLLEQTLRGSIQALCDTLALASPTVFGKATRVKKLCSSLGPKLGVTDLWQLEVAAMVCQLGAVTLPTGVFERSVRRETMPQEEREMLLRVPSVTDRLLANIPRLDAVRDIVRHCRDGFVHPRPVAGADGKIPIGARILRVALDFDDCETCGDGPADALLAMRRNGTEYDPTVLDALAARFQEAREEIVELPISSLRQGMFVAADVTTESGALLVPRGQEVTPMLLGRLDNFAASLKTKTIRVFQSAPIGARPRAAVG